MGFRKKTTISDIADKLNVTPSTVSRALKDHPRISDRTKKAVRKLVDELEYQPNNIASALRNGKSNIVGVMVPTSDRSFFASFIRGVEEVLRDEGFNLMICQSDDQFQKECAGIDTLINVRVDGIIASVAKETIDFSHYKKIKKMGTPLVLYDRVIPDLGVNQVVSDDFYGSYKAVTHLAEQGCRRIAHFAGEQHIHIYQNRLEGYLQALRDLQIEIDEEMIIESDLIRERDKIILTGREMADKLMSMNNRPDGIFSSSDFAAIGAMQRFIEKNIHIPEEIAITGYSNDFSTTVIEPGLTSVDQHTVQMGNLAAEQFLNHIRANKKEFLPRKILVKPELMVRGSSSRVQNGSDS
ncbi:LacI family transcriptional regulator [Rhodohalobacter sp. SW132]|uniref:LacI family DNA-binding transcriptional regulator n=1 Tax=Rhodohalobacter sp. SW132 TaxID=2293433 RepID=UPI000E281243|nr:LacI family DNA-binding transcriptional regulator [Rhodohalobacter sp. SW132]REL38621.1 LacI family transcriptional regulator [Rhodohalobacter sp. SW132]